LATTSNPVAYAAQFKRFPDRLGLLLTVLGASQPMADTLAQNPEFGSLFLDPQETESMVTSERLVREGRLLLQSSTGQTHALDRIRYLRQKHNLAICINDVGGSWEQETVWAALSDLADAVVKLVFQATWKQFVQGKDLPEEPPIAIVAFGKLGGRELNYSSDIDLAYVLKDGSNERLERECSKFCAVFGRALTDRMGRGALYRVDLRLRPYGSQGAILVRAASFRNYYELYAEAWEIQALLKSRVIFGEWAQSFWDEIKERKAFGASLSDASLSEVLKVRARIEDFAADDDLKRGPGGIRDVEFLCQTLQLIYSHNHPEVRGRSTCDALRGLSEVQLIEPSLAQVLIEGYTFLRKLEHRIQLLGDRQTYSLPASEPTRNKLAVLMGFDDSAALISALDLRRKSIRSLYRSILKQDEEGRGARERISERLASRGLGAETAVFHQWFDALPESEAYYRSVEADEPAIDRVATILRFAPRLISRFKANLSLTDALIGGEIEEVGSDESRWLALPLDASERTVSDAYTNAVAAAEAKWIFAHGPEIKKAHDHSLEPEMEAAADGLLRYCCRRFQASFDLIALGSYGSGQMSPCSDFDILLLSQTNQREAETTAQQILAFLLQLRRFGLEPTVDLRLRPDGQKGLLVRSYNGFGAYEVGDMETWERFALGNGRLVYGSPEALDLVRHAAYATALTPSRLGELADMKERIENERLKPQYQNRDVKLGHGGLSDLEWTVHLLEMRDPQRVEAGSQPVLARRIRNLGRYGVLNAFEVESLLSAQRHLLDLRNWILLLEFPRDVMPENPTRLNRLAQAFGLEDGNELLRVHEPIVAWVRGFMLDTLSRLKA
jgi:glutamate-ammonia-ligase adenylyltransferase